ncbi:MAG: DUF2809 domain-containing protein [Proteobacteria bacterium]|nr:DUF2809 domain-containing protein [Pseudomonadota bacterium]
MSRFTRIIVGPPETSGRHTYSRSRYSYAAAVMVVIALGLASRKFPGLFPAALEKYPGDALWALMVFVALCAFLPNAKTWRLAAFALLASYAVEFSQLYQAPWIDSIRSTTLGHLVLGSGFSWVDLLAYAIGIAVGSACDLLWLRMRLLTPSA